MSEKPTVIKTSSKPCGCVLTEYDDDSSDLKPCQPCGIHEAAMALHRAAQALAGVAESIRQVQKEAAMAQAIMHAANGGKK